MVHGYIFIYKHLNHDQYGNQGFEMDKHSILILETLLLGTSKKKKHFPHPIHFFFGHLKKQNNRIRSNKTTENIYLI